MTEFEALGDLVLSDKARFRKWKNWTVSMSGPWDEFRCGPDNKCPIEQWMRSDDGTDTGFLWCNWCAATGITPDEFYSQKAQS